VSENNGTLKNTRFFQDDFSAVDPEVLKAIEHGVRKGLQEYTKTKCDVNCPIPKELASEFGHLEGVLKDASDNDSVSGGLKVIREQIGFVKKVIRRTDNVGSWIARTVVIAIVVAIITLISIGFWTKVKGGG
jgi:hypothetical protein